MLGNASYNFQYQLIHNTIINLRDAAENILKKKQICQQAKNKYTKNNF